MLTNFEIAELLRELGIFTIGIVNSYECKTKSNKVHGENLIDIDNDILCKRIPPPSYLSKFSRIWLLHRDVTLRLTWMQWNDLTSKTLQVDGKRKGCNKIYGRRYIYHHPRYRYRGDELKGPCEAYLPESAHILS